MACPACPVLYAEGWRRRGWRGVAVGLSMVVSLACRLCSAWPFRRSLMLSGDRSREGQGRTSLLRSTWCSASREPNRARSHSVEAVPRQGASAPS